jgi:hypothetical protein
MLLCGKRFPRVDEVWRVIARAVQQQDGRQRLLGGWREQQILILGVATAEGSGSNIRRGLANWHSNRSQEPYDNHEFL